MVPYSGISAALSDNCSDIVLTAYKTAKSLGLTTSIDLNYRRKLWTPEKARRCMAEIMPYIDVLIGNEEDIEIMLGMKPAGSNVEAGILDIDGYKEVFIMLRKKYGFKFIASTLRESISASDNGWSVLLYDGNEFFRSREYKLHLIDRGGGGASFSAGLIYSLLHELPIAEAGEFSAAVSALKQTIIGDFNLITLNEAKKLAAGNISGRVQR